MERKRNTINNNSMRAIVSVAAVLVMVGVFFGGYLMGKNSVERANAEKVEEIARAVRSKADYIEKLEGLYKEGWKADSETIDKTGIGEYVGNLEKLISETGDEGIKGVLNEYLGAWKKLEGVYEGKDNEAIMKAFEEVKTEAEKAEQKIQEILDGWIEDALKK